MNFYFYNMAWGVFHLNKTKLLLQFHFFIKYWNFNREGIFFGLQNQTGTFFWTKFILSSLSSLKWERKNENHSGMTEKLISIFCVWTFLTYVFFQILCLTLATLAYGRTTTNLHRVVRDAPRAAPLGLLVSI